jgi:hypothetical protein
MPAALRDGPAGSDQFFADKGMDFAGANIRSRTGLVVERCLPDRFDRVRKPGVAEFDAEGFFQAKGKIEVVYAHGSFERAAHEVSALELQKRLLRARLID